MKTTADTVNYGKTSKLERYNWTIQDQPGQMQMIAKGDLQIDHLYQRHANEDKLKAIARDWSWIACGAITVADRGGVLFVVDGQHRVLAARRRIDIIDMPCVVFKTHEAKQEAKGFLTAQTQRKPMYALEKFKALLVIEDKAAQLVQKLIDVSGITIGTKSSTNSVMCIGVLIRAANSNAEILNNLWPLIISVCEGRALHERIVEGLIYIEKHMPNGASLMDNEWQRRVKKTGADALLDGAVKASAFFSRGGEKVWAAGMIEAINRNHRNRLVIE